LSTGARNRSPIEALDSGLRPRPRVTADDVQRYCAKVLEVERPLEHRGSTHVTRSLGETWGHVANHAQCWDVPSDRTETADELDSTPTAERCFQDQEVRQGLTRDVERKEIAI
jgi:hypothetical protein